jgi:hypothetical protein
MYSPKSIVVAIIPSMESSDESFDDGNAISSNDIPESLLLELLSSSSISSVTAIKLSSARLSANVFQ